ncbi:MAG: glycosyltransferase family 39 protein [Herpetosiphon sp.]
MKVQIQHAQVSTRYHQLFWTAVVPAGLLALAATLCFYRLGFQSLWLDEGFSASYVAGQHVRQLLVDLFMPTQAYPGYHLILKITMRLLGDGEWALRLPSAVAGSLAVPAMYLLGSELWDRRIGIVAAVLLMASPFALAQAQDAKAYSLTLLVTILLWYTLLRALRRHSRGRWALWIGIMLIAPFVHRLLVLPVAGSIVAVAWLAPGLSRQSRVAFALVGVCGAAALGAAIGWSLRRQGAGGQFIPAGPWRALQLTFAKWAVDRYGCDGAGQCDIARRWLVAPAILAVLGVSGLCFGLVRGDRRARRTVAMIAALAGVPLLVFLILFTVQPFYEPRYLSVVFPVWPLLLACGVVLPLRELHGAAPRLLVGTALLGAILFVDRYALLQPEHGLWSGAAVKEDYRGAVRELARHVHPDDMVIVHPEVINNLYQYYARRESSQPLPAATTFSPGERSKGFQPFELRDKIGATLKTHPRAWLLIAPAHANLVDPPPNPQAGDELGWVGLAFKFGDRNGRLPCGLQPYAGFNGVRLYCNNVPEVNGVVPQPAQRVQADFGGRLRLRGWTVTPFAGGPRPGGTLPVTLFWEPLRSLAGSDYSIFIHLTRRDDPTVIAQADGPPMEGGSSTGRWTKAHLVLHDDRTIPLPATLAPGTYALRVGVYAFTPNGGTQRLTAASSAPMLDNGVVVGTVEIK